MREPLYEKLRIFPSGLLEKVAGLVFESSPGESPHACLLSLLLVGERTGRVEGTTHARVLSDRSNPESVRRIMAKLLGAGDVSRATVAAGAVSSVLALLVRIEKGRWHATGRPPRLGEERTFEGNV